MTIISPQLGISPTATAGGESYDREVLKQFVKLNQDVHLLLPKAKSIPEDITGWKINRTPFKRFVPPYTFNFFSLPWALRLAQPNSVLRIHSPEYLFPTAYLVKKLRPDTPVVAHYHLDQTNRLWTKMNQKLLNLVDAVIVDSAYLKQQLMERVKIKKTPIHVIHCGVDIDQIQPAKKKLVNKDIKTLLYLGRFIKRKRPDFAIKVFAKLYKKHPNTRLVMVGEGPMQAELKTLSKKLKIDTAVEFPGPLFGKEKLKQYHQADLFIFPSEKEGFVLVVLEAMAAGLPLLVPNAISFPEAVKDGQNGHLAKVNDIHDWVDKAEKILFSSKINLSMRQQSRKIAVNQFSWETCAKKNLKVYENLLSISN